MPANLSKWGRAVAAILDNPIAILEWRRLRRRAGNWRIWVGLRWPPDPIAWGAPVRCSAQRRGCGRPRRLPSYVHRPQDWCGPLRGFAVAHSHSRSRLSTRLSLAIRFALCQCLGQLHAAYGDVTQEGRGGFRFDNVLWYSSLDYER